MLNLFFHVFKKVKREATKVNSVVNFNSPNTFSWLSYTFKTDWILYQAMNFFQVL